MPYGSEEVVAAINELKREQRKTNEYLELNQGLMRVIVNHLTSIEDLLKKD